MKIDLAIKFMANLHIVSPGVSVGLTLNGV
jgi:hypothetical protein